MVGGQGCGVLLVGLLVPDGLRHSTAALAVRAEGVVGVHDPSARLAEYLCVVIDAEGVIVDVGVGVDEVHRLAGAADSFAPLTRRAHTKNTQRMLGVFVCHSLIILLRFARSTTWR